MKPRKKGKGLIQLSGDPLTALITGRYSKGAGLAAALLSSFLHCHVIAVTVAPDIVISAVEPSPEAELRWSPDLGLSASKTVR